MPTPFAQLTEEKTATAADAQIVPLQTIAISPSIAAAQQIGNAWTRHYYDGPFHLVPVPPAIPATSLVFVESRDGNTGADNPDVLGGGPTDKHLIYEGLSRVAAEAVLAGAGSTKGANTFFSVWHPQLVALRSALGLPRHPTQIVVSRRGDIDLSAMLFNVPEVPVMVIAGAECRQRWQDAFAARRWLTVLPLEPDDLPGVFRKLRRDHGIARVSAIGGRATATALIDAGLVQELFLTTTSSAAGQPGTPFYSGAAPPSLECVVMKKTTSAAVDIVFRQLLLSPAR